MSSLRYLVTKIVPRSAGWSRLVRASPFSTGSTSTSDQTIHDIEKELFKIKRTMATHYNNREYKEALLSALELEEQVAKVYGKKNAVYASCKNNMALMNKELGNISASLEQYTEALQIYEDTIGKKQRSYAATLANIGLLFKAEAEKTKGIEKLDMLDRADEALTDALVLRVEILGKTHKDTILSSNYVALIRAAQGRFIEAESVLLSCLSDAMELLGEEDLLVALLHNNLGYILKLQKKFDPALTHYNKALATRNKLLKDTHVDILVTMHNIAELFHSKGDEEAANKWRTDIVALVGEDSVYAQVADESDPGQDNAESSSPNDEVKDTKTEVSVSKSHQSSSNGGTPRKVGPDDVAEGDEGFRRTERLSRRKAGIDVEYSPQDMEVEISDYQPSRKDPSSL